MRWFGGVFVNLGGGFFVVLLAIFLILLFLAMYLACIALAVAISPGIVIAVLLSIAAGVEVSREALWGMALACSVVIGAGFWYRLRDRRKTAIAYVVLILCCCLGYQGMVSAGYSNITGTVDRMVWGGTGTVGDVLGVKPNQNLNNPPTAPATTPISKQKQDLPEIGKGTITGDNVNLRILPSVKGPIVGKLKAGENVVVRMEDEEWLFVQVGNKSGWVSSQFVKMSEE